MTTTNSYVHCPSIKTVHQLFEEQVLKAPDALAVVYGENKVTYHQLNTRINQLANYLRSKAVIDQTLVPICIEQGVDMVVSILAVLKAGGAYVPIDPDYPADRISYMLEDTGASVVISNKANKLKLPITQTFELIEIDNDYTDIEQCSPNNLQPAVREGQLAYIIYTSGSTGKPKGVMIEHKSLLNYLLNDKTSYIDTREHNCGSYIHLSYSFDASLTAIFMPLLCGKPVVIGTKHSVDVFEDGNLLKYAPYDFIKITPSHLELLQPKFKAFGKKLLTKKLVIGGEALYPAKFDSFIKEGIDVEVVNEYGPTEATVGCTTYNFHTITEKNKIRDRVSIGKPIDNVDIYILDASNKVVSAGVKGEICIGGTGVARGYLNKEGLTSEKFIMNPVTDKSGERIYKTGDIGSWRSDGNIEYYGRIDEQVKVRGYRIELGEIEHVLLQSKLISQGVVVCIKDRTGNNALVGYVVANKTFSREALIAYLEEILPGYMVPAIWIELENLPLTPNGKIDKKGLPDPHNKKISQDEYVAPRNKTEATLAKIMQDVLKMKKIGIHDDFFELGGNSIQAVVIFSKIKRAFGGIQLPLSTLFKTTTVEKLAVLLGEQKEIGFSKSCLVPIKPYGFKPPLFLVHAGAGTVLFYRDLAENLGTEQPVYGLQAKGLNGNETPHTKIEDMAAHYIHEIKTLQPNGPYFLAGYCFGGIVAFEMAHQLKRMGEEIALLATINSRSPTYVDPSVPSGEVMNTELFGSGKISYHLKQLAGLSTKERLRYPYKRIKHKVLTYQPLYEQAMYWLRSFFYNYYLSRNLPLPQILGRSFFLDTNDLFEKAYKLQKYDGRMIVFRSPEIFKALHAGWGDLVSGEIETIDIPGEHPNRRAILVKPFVLTLAQELKNILTTTEHKKNYG